MIEGERHRGFRESSVASLVRGPKTPVRWMCLQAFSYVAWVQHKALSRQQKDILCQAVELGVFLNRCFDSKTTFDVAEYRSLRQGLPGTPTREYLGALKELELSRPQRHEWIPILEYRREVLRVSLHYLFQLAHLETSYALLPICCLIQLSDDVLDWRIDKKLSLPTFLAPGAPDPSELARKFWRELRSIQDWRDLPFVWSGWYVYLFTRIVISCFQFTERILSGRDEP